MAGHPFASGATRVLEGRRHWPVEGVEIPIEDEIDEFGRWVGSNRYPIERTGPTMLEFVFGLIFVIALIVGGTMA